VSDGQRAPGIEICNVHFRNRSGPWLDMVAGATSGCLVMYDRFYTVSTYALKHLCTLVWCLCGVCVCVCVPHSPPVVEIGCTIRLRLPSCEELEPGNAHTCLYIRSKTHLFLNAAFSFKMAVYDYIQIKGVRYHAHIHAYITPSCSHTAMMTSSKYNRL
jgi:hypothetical protein